LESEQYQMRTILFRAGLALLLLWTAGCASLAPRPDLPVEIGSAEGTTTALDQLLAGPEARHPGQSAFRLIPDGLEAFAIRAHGARLAGRSLDVQTYLWHDDLTGSLLAARLLEAADRGVKVRLLLDDMDARNNERAFGALDAHEHIDVRVFNPFATRSGSLGFLLEAVGSFGRINQRMHNKSWIIDNRLAVVGGRNLGDEYFDASSGTNFVDLDFAMVGPVVRDATASFDRYWNSAEAYPIGLLAGGHATPERLAALRSRLEQFGVEARQSRYAAELQRDDGVRRLVEGDWPLHWSAKYSFVADDPLKFRGEGGGVRGSQVVGKLAPAISGARTDVTIISPYFVPGDEGTRGLVELDSSGRPVRILTNSLAANDVAAVYGGYSRYRRPLLEGGVELWELKPTGTGNPSLFGSSGASLHTKALVIDRNLVFVGSYNLDPRSTSLNSEQGVLVEDVELSRQLLDIFEIQTSSARAWKVTLEDGELAWTDATARLDQAPDASAWRRFQAWCARVLHLDSQL
jgi:putative cardiolipin synthase